MNGRIKHKLWKRAFARVAARCTFSSRKERREFVNHVAHAVRHVTLDEKRAKKNKRKG